MEMKIKFNLNEGFKVVPEGKRTLEIIKAEAKPSGKPSAIHITFKDSDGGQLINCYDLNVQPAVIAFGYICKYTLNTADADEIDTTTDLPKLIGKKVVCEVVHTKGTQPKEDGTFPVFANIKKVIGSAENTTTSPRASITSAVGNDLD